MDRTDGHLLGRGRNGTNGWIGGNWERAKCVESGRKDGLYMARMVVVIVVEYAVSSGCSNIGWRGCDYFGRF